MEFNTYIRKPFIVEAVEITDENIEEVAALIGKIKINEETEVAFIALDRRVIPNVGRAYVGWWLTKLGDNYRCYAPKVFTEQFIEQVSNPTYLTLAQGADNPLTKDDEVDSRQLDHEESDPADAHGLERPTSEEDDTFEPATSQGIADAISNVFETKTDELSGNPSTKNVSVLATGAFDVT